ncbi:MAG: DUF308 domain-containing protein [Bacteroidales bacterium]|nr:DUF308 domain-containing protein [Bacteroidales bacterium]
MKQFKLNTWIFPGLHGFLAVLFGLIALLFPSITLIGLAIYFAIMIILGGLLLILSSVRMRSFKGGRYWQLLEGITGVLLGTVILIRPELSVAVFVAITGIWAMLLGLFFLVIYFRKQLQEFEQYFFLIAGFISFIFGLLIALNPFKSSRIMMVLIGIYAIAYGIFSIVRTRMITGSISEES